MLWWSLQKWETSIQRADKQLLLEQMELLRLLGQWDGTLLLFTESNYSCMLIMVVSKTVSIPFQTYSYPTLCGESYSPKASTDGDSGAGSVTPPESGAEKQTCGDDRRARRIRHVQVPSDNNFWGRG